MTATAVSLYSALKLRLFSFGGNSTVGFEALHPRFLPFYPICALTVSNGTPMDPIIFSSHCKAIDGIRKANHTASLLHSDWKLVIRN